MFRELAVLLVDDNHDMRDVISLLLNNLNHVSLAGVVTDGDEAIDMCKRKHIDVVLMDIQMPRMDGITTAKVIKSRFPDTRIIAYSSDQTREKEVRDAGADYFISKPATVSDIENTLELIQIEVMM